MSCVPNALHVAFSSWVGGVHVGVSSHDQGVVDLFEDFCHAQLVPQHGKYCL